MPIMPPYFLHYVTGDGEMGYQPKSRIAKIIMGCAGLTVLPALPLNAKEVLGAPKVEPIEILQVHGQQYRRATTMTKPGEAII